MNTYEVNMFRQYFQDPDEVYDNPCFLEMYETEVVCPEVKLATACGDIENETDLENFVDKLWTKYRNWLVGEMSYEVHHE